MRMRNHDRALAVAQATGVGALLLALAGSAMAMPACLNGVAPMVKTGRFAAALAQLETCPTRHADDPDLLLQKGRALTETGRLDEALVVFGRLVETQPSWASALNNLAVVQAKSGRLAEALVSLEKAVQISPNFLLAQENLADVREHLARGKVSGKVSVNDPALRGAPPQYPQYGEKTDGRAPEAATNMVKAWAEDWSTGNWTGYRGHYDAKFNPTEGRSVAVWELERQRKVAGRKDISVTLSDIKVKYFGNVFAEARFVQDYRSGNYADRGRKVLQLVHRPAGWRILREIFEAMQ